MCGYVAVLINCGKHNQFQIVRNSKAEFKTPKINVKKNATKSSPRRATNMNQLVNIVQNIPLTDLLPEKCKV